MKFEEPISYIGTTNGRIPRKRFGIKQRDRLNHVYVVGKTGTGKTTLLETLVLQDIRAGRGCALIDPHGDLAARLATQIPASRENEFIYLNAPDSTQPYG